MTFVPVWELGTHPNWLQPSSIILQYKVLFTKIFSDLRHYSPDGPEKDLSNMLEIEFGTVLSVIMKRSSTPMGACLLGTAEVTFATEEGQQKCIKASTGQYLFLHGRNLHAKAV